MQPLKALYQLFFNKDTACTDSSKQQSAAKNDYHKLPQPNNSSLKNTDVADSVDARCHKGIIRYYLLGDQQGTRVPMFLVAYKSLEQYMEWFPRYSVVQYEAEGTSYSEPKKKKKERISNKLFLDEEKQGPKEIRVSIIPKVRVLYRGESAYEQIAGLRVEGDEVRIVGRGKGVFLDMDINEPIPKTHPLYQTELYQALTDKQLANDFYYASARDVYRKEVMGRMVQKYPGIQDYLLEYIGMFESPTECDDMFWDPVPKWPYLTYSEIDKEGYQNPYATFIKDVVDKHIESIEHRYRWLSLFDYETTGEEFVENVTKIVPVKKIDFGNILTLAERIVLAYKNIHEGGPYIGHILFKQTLIDQVRKLNTKYSLAPTQEKRIKR